MNDEREDVPCLLCLIVYSRKKSTTSSLSVDTDFNANLLELSIGKMNQ
jgi:hypothetical protein